MTDRDDPLSVCCRHLANSQAIIERKNAEIERLQEAIRRLADQDATLSVCDGNVTVTMDAACPYVTGTVTQYCTLTPFTLTEGEREAIEAAADFIDAKSYASADTLRSLLERTK